ncbi:alpha/beta hydrolase [Thermocatellispora tengchongensis]
MSGMDIHVTEWGSGPPAVFVHGVLTWGADELYGFAAQRPLAARHRLLLMDRRGHGRSPDVGGAYGTDYEVDAADIEELLGEGAHLVAHSYGAAGAMLAAVRRPELVRSLTLIHPGVLRPAEEHPVIAETLRRNRRATAELPPDLTPADYLRLSVAGVGMPVPEATPERLRAARSAMRERPCWDADIPLGPLAAMPCPKLVISGTWDGAPEEYRKLAGEPLMVAAEFIASRIGAGHVTVPGYYPHVQEPGLVNAAIEDLWRA